jgi:hypothetical protein
MVVCVDVDQKFHLPVSLVVVKIGGYKMAGVIGKEGINAQNVGPCKMVHQHIVSKLGVFLLLTTFAGSGLIGRFRANVLLPKVCTNRGVTFTFICLPESGYNIRSALKY